MNVTICFHSISSSFISQESPLCTQFPKWVLLNNYESHVNQSHGAHAMFADATISFKFAFGTLLFNHLNYAHVCDNAAYYKTCPCINLNNHLACIIHNHLGVLMWPWYSNQLKTHWTRVNSRWCDLTITTCQRGHVLQQKHMSVAQATLYWMRACYFPSGASEWLFFFFSLGTIPCHSLSARHHRLCWFEYLVSFHALIGVNCIHLARFAGN